MKQKYFYLISFFLMCFSSCKNSDKSNSTSTTLPQLGKSPLNEVVKILLPQKQINELK
jgi:hypothetical protein